MQETNVQFIESKLLKSIVPFLCLSKEKERKERPPRCLGLQVTANFLQRRLALAGTLRFNIPVSAKLCKPSRFAHWQPILLFSKADGKVSHSACAKLIPLVYHFLIASSHHAEKRKGFLGEGVCLSERSEFTRRRKVRVFEESTCTLINLDNKAKLLRV